MQIEVVTLEYDYYSEINGQLLLVVKTMESIGINNTKQVIKVLSEVIGIKRKWPGFDKIT